LLIAHCLLELLLSNLDIADFGDIVTRSRTANIGIKTEKSKGQDD